MKATLLLAIAAFLTLSSFGQTELYSYDEQFELNRPDVEPVVLDLSLLQNEEFTSIQGTWNREFTVPGIVGTIGAGATDGINLYLGGLFSTAGGIRANSIVRWNGQGWSSIGEGPENGIQRKFEGDVPYVHAMAYVDGKLFVGGQFGRAGSLEVNGITYWDGEQWNRLGQDSTDNGVTRRYITGEDTLNARGFVYSLFVHEQKLYVGGYFQFAGGIPSEGVAVWNLETEQWESMKGGLKSIYEYDPVYAYAFAARDNALIVGGKFFEAGGVPVQHIAKWDGTNWTAFGQPEGYIYDLDTDEEGRLFACGYTLPDHNTRHCGLAIYDGTQWTPVLGPSGFLSSIDRIHVHKGEIYTLGSFNDTVSWLSHSNLAKWTEDEWTFIPGLGQAGNDFLTGGANVIETANDKLYIAGSFSRAGELFVVNVVEYDVEEGEWKKPDTGQPSHGIYDGSVTNFGSDGQRLYAGGFFSVAGGTFARNIAQWTGTEWKSVGTEYNNGVRGSLNCILVDGDEVYVGGHFGSAGSVEAYHVARWDGTTWHALGIGVGGVSSAQINALAKVGDYLYVGGYFSIVGDVENYALPASSIARFNLRTERWESLGKGIEYYTDVPGWVFDFEVDSNRIYVAGRFHFADHMYFENFAVLTDNKWGGIGDNEDIGIEGDIKCVRVINDELYIGGALWPEGFQFSPGLMKWVDKQWDPVGEPLSNKNGTVYVNDIEPFRDGFIIGGDFHYAGEIAVNHIAYFDGTDWHPIGGGLLPGVSDIEVLEKDIFFGCPSESLAGGYPTNGIAHFELEETTAIDPVDYSPLVYGQLSNYPNPFRGRTTIRYRTIDAEPLHVIIFGQSGRIVDQFSLKQQPAGVHEFTWDAGHLPAGTYYCQIIGIEGRSGGELISLKP